MNKLKNLNIIELFEALNQVIPQSFHDFGRNQGKEYTDILTAIAQNLQKNLRIFCKETGYKATLILEQDYLDQAGVNHEYKWAIPEIYIDLDNGNDLVKYSTDGNSFYEFTEQLKNEKSKEFAMAVADLIYLGDSCSRGKFFCIKEVNIKITPDEINLDVYIPVCSIEHYQMQL